MGRCCNGNCCQGRACDCVPDVTGFGDEVALDPGEERGLLVLIGILCIAFAAVVGSCMWMGARP